MKAILSAILVAAVTALWLWGKYHQAKAATKDLGDGASRSYLMKKIQGSPLPSSWLVCFGDATAARGHGQVDVFRGAIKRGAHYAGRHSAAGNLLSKRLPRA